MTLPLSVSDILKEASVFSELTFPLASCLPSCASPSHLLPKPMLGKACWVSGFQILGQEGKSPEVPAWQRPETLNHRLPLPLVFELKVLRSSLFRQGSLSSVFKWEISKQLEDIRIAAANALVAVSQALTVAQVLAFVMLHTLDLRFYLRLSSE